MIKITGFILLMLAFIAGLSDPALAHVKWFAPYIVESSPRAIGFTLTDVWFWTGLGGTGLGFPK